jgi:hypothetical protein
MGLFDFFSKKPEPQKPVVQVIPTVTAKMVNFEAMR